MANCSSCGRSILWARTPNGTASPYDPAASPEGNVLLLRPSALGEVLAVVLSGGVLDRARARGAELRLSHFATCPSAEQHRKRS